MKKSLAIFLGIVFLGIFLLIIYYSSDPQLSPGGTTGVCPLPPSVMDDAGREISITQSACSGRSQYCGGKTCAIDKLTRGSTSINSVSGISVIIAGRTYDKLTVKDSFACSDPQVPEDGNNN